MDAIEKFITRVNKAANANSKEIRLLMPDAKELVIELAVISARTATLSDKVISLQAKLLDKNEGIVSVEADGGSFRP